MGLNPVEVEEITMAQFSLMYTGYLRKQEIEISRVREIVAMIYNRGGMGAVEPKLGSELWPLSIDKENEKRPITSLRMAQELLSEFKPY